MRLRGWPAMRAAARIASRDARRARGRTALVAALIGLPVLVGVTGITLISSVPPTTAQELADRLGDRAQAEISSWVGTEIEQDAFGANGGFGYVGGGAGAPSLRAYETDLVSVLPVGSTLVRATTGSLLPRSETRTPSSADDVTEIQAEHMADVITLDLAEGHLPRESGDLLLSQAAAEHLSVGLGGTVTFTVPGHDDVELTVSGILAPAPSTAPRFVTVSGAVFPEAADAGETMGTPFWYVLGDEPITWDHVLAINELGSVVTSRAVVLDPDAYGAPRPSSGGADDGAVAMAAVVVAMCLIEAVLLIGPAFAVGAQRSQRQLATIAASGADARTLRRIVLLGGVTIGVFTSMAATALGIASAAGIRWWANAVEPFAFRSFQVPWWLVPAAIAIGMIVATAAAWLPARRAGGLDVVAALGGRRAESRSRRWIPVTGGVLALAGTAAAVSGAAASDATLLVIGVLAMELGIIAVSGVILSVVARLAPRFRVAGRFALRDAARQRGRTAPAVAAIVAALAGVTAGTAYAASSSAQSEAIYQAVASEGAVAVSMSWSESLRLPTPADLAIMAESVTAHLPVDEVVTVRTGIMPATEDDLQPVASWLTAVPPEGSSWDCPLWAQDASIHDYADAAGDPRCRTGMWGHTVWETPDHGSVLVDDGTAMARLGVPGAEEAARALARGEVVVAGSHLIADDGTALLELEQESREGGEPTVIGHYSGPATALALGHWAYDLILPPAVAEDLGYGIEATGILATTSRMPTEAEESAARRELRAELPEASVYVERGSQTPTASPTVWVLVIGAAIVGLGASLMSVALAQAETRPDLATLAAVGAPAGVRRRIAAGQAGVLTIIGSVLGVSTGLLLAWVLVISEQYRYQQPDPSWQLIIPWPAVAVIGLGIPALAMIAAWLFTRSRLPMVRRIAA